MEMVSHAQIAFVSFSDRTLALQPFLLQEWASGLNWNYPSWSISTEMEAYIYFVFFAGVLLKGRRERRAAQLATRRPDLAEAVRSGRMKLPAALVGSQVPSEDTFGRPAQGSVAPRKPPSGLG
jgi:hypothetical protein